MYLTIHEMLVTTSLHSCVHCIVFCFLFWLLPLFVMTLFDDIGNDVSKCLTCCLHYLYKCMIYSFNCFPLALKVCFAVLVSSFQATCMSGCRQCRTGSPLTPPRTTPPSTPTSCSPGSSASSSSWDRLKCSRQLPPRSMLCELLHVCDHQICGVQVVVSLEWRHNLLFPLRFIEVQLSAANQICVV